MAAQGRHFWFFGFLCFVALCSGELCEIDCTITSDGSQNPYTIAQCFDDYSRPTSVCEKYSIGLYSTGTISGEGNTNLRVNETSHIESLHISLMEVNVETGFFLYIENTIKFVSIGSGTISGGSSTVFRFVSSDPGSVFQVQSWVITGTKSDGFGAMHIDSAGMIELNPALNFLHTKSSGDCGALRIDSYPTTKYTSKSVANGAPVFIDTRADGNGGAVCLFSSDETNSMNWGSFAIREGSSAGKNGGTIYAAGAGQFRFSSFKDVYVQTHASINGSYIYAENITSLEIVDYNTALEHQSSAQNGAIYVVNAELVQIYNSTLSSSQVSNSGGVLYIKNVVNFEMRNNYFPSGDATYGIGGIVLFENVNRIEVTNSSFHSGTAQRGSAMACIGGSYQTIISDVQFTKSMSSSFDMEYLDIYSDGSCSASFWYSRYDCPALCGSCNSTVCGVSNQNIGYDVCNCYCGESSCGSYNGTSTPSPTVSISASTAPSVSERVSLSPSKLPSENEEQGTSNDSSSLWLYFTVGILIIVGGMIIAGGIGFAIFQKHQRTDEQGIELELE